MFELRQALLRGVDYLATVREQTGHSAAPSTTPNGSIDSTAFVVTVLSELAARGIPRAAAVARDRASCVAEHVDDGSIESAPPLTTGEVDEILGAQESDGSWRAIPGTVARAGAGATAADPLSATAACLHVLAGAIPRISPRADLETAFWRDGYFVVEKFLTPADIEALAQANRQVHGTLAVGFYTGWFQPPEARVFTDREVRATVAAGLKTLFPDHRMIFGTFMSKGCEGDTAFPLHQDPSFVDERKWTSVTFWVPLIDVDGGNGCIYAVPGSHLLSANPRLPYKAFPYTDFAERLNQCLRPIPMRAGDLLVFHPGLIHASPPNLSGHLRIAVSGHMAPEAAQVFVYRNRGDESGVTEVFAVDDTYYIGMVGEEEALSEGSRVAELKPSGLSSAIDRMLSDMEAEVNGDGAARHLREGSSSSAGPPMHVPPGPDAAEERELGSAASKAPTGGRPCSGVEPAFCDALSVAVSRATATAWELVDVGRETGLLTLKVRTPVGEVFLDIRRVTTGAKCFKTVDGMAYSYRRTDREMPKDALNHLESVIAHLRPHTPTMDLLCTPESLFTPAPSAGAQTGAARLD